MAPDEALNHLHEEIEHAAHLLPAQGPITVFIHHNTLHAFEDLPFEQAVTEGQRVFGCQPYLSEGRYRDELARGRIRFGELRAVLSADLGPAAAGEAVARLCSRIDLRLAMLQFPVRGGTAAEVQWFVEETEALSKVRPEVSAPMRARMVAETRRWVMRDLRGGHDGGPRRGPAWVGGLFRRFRVAAIESWGQDTWEAFAVQALWEVCKAGASLAPPPVPVSAPAAGPVVRHRDLLLRATGVDTDTEVHDLLIRYCAAFLDQGVSPWPLPDRHLGLYGAFLSLYGRAGGPPNRLFAGLQKEIHRLREDGVSALESVRESLELLGVPHWDWGAYLSHSLLALRGWAGMIRQLEVRGDRVALPAPEGSLADFLAVRLLLERLALAQAAREAIGYTGPLSGLACVVGGAAALAGPPPLSAEQKAFRIFQLAQVLGWSPEELSRLAPPQWAELWAEIDAFGEVPRRRIFHLAYEHRFLTSSLDAVAARAAQPAEKPAVPSLQVVCCLDEREESFRRHIEEIDPTAETFGAAGFYGVAMYYRGAADAHFVPLCPVVIRPQHWVEEEVDDEQQDEHRRRARARRALGRASHGFHVGSRTFALGAVLTAGFGWLASVPLVARILFPRFSSRIGRLFGRFVQAPPRTRLQLERAQGSPPGPENGHRGFSLDEMATTAERLLRDIGLTSRFARLVLVLGHGSYSLNNPHKSAYDCGACGGSPGGPNGRAAARILNDPRVRRRLAERGLVIPDETVFVGGLHNTCDDSVTLYDTVPLDDTHRADLVAARGLIQSALARNAHERCRRFQSAPLTLSFAAAHQHVEGRSEDLAQTRPELGHATNALCVVGRRSRVRGLFLDRRAFLASYDPTQDTPDRAVLTRILLAAVPVCAGINLEYYFSRVDSAGWGCGTKLPHNIVSLLGVMDGAASDLRTGLPWQMVEIHEPVRLLFVIEATPEAMLRIMDANEVIGKTIRNGWAHLALLSPDDARVWLFRDGEFRPHQPQSSELPTAPTSADWYRGWRDHLEFARIGG